MKIDPYCQRCNPQNVLFNIMFLALICGVPRWAAFPLLFMLGDSVLCGSHPLVTPYYCRLEDLLWSFVSMRLLYFFCYFCTLCVLFLQYFDTVGWVFWPVKTVARITYTVLVESLNPAHSLHWFAIDFVARGLHTHTAVTRLAAYLSVS